MKMMTSFITSCRKKKILSFGVLAFLTWEMMTKPGVLPSFILKKSSGDHNIKNKRWRFIIKQGFQVLSIF